MTKVDKLVLDDKKRMTGIVQRIRTETKRYNAEADVPIIFTSSESKGGGACVWSAMIDILHQDQPFDFSSLWVPKDH